MRRSVLQPPIVSSASTILGHPLHPLIASKCYDWPSQGVIQSMAPKSRADRDNPFQLERLLKYRVLMSGHVLRISESY